MDEWVQDLTSALDDPSLKYDIDGPGDMTGSDMKIDRDCRKRKMRKRRTTNSNGFSSVGNSAFISHMNNSARSSSSLDEAAKDYRRAESFTANCSSESPEKEDGIHHRRVFRQTKPSYFESDSHTESGPAHPRKYRKKKPRRMAIDSSLYRDAKGGSPQRPREVVKVRKQYKKFAISSENTPVKHEKMNCEAPKTKREGKTTIACIDCHKKSCDRMTPQCNSGAAQADHGGKTNSGEAATAAVTCQCGCHATLGKDESSLSGSSGNSDTDSANFTPDDIGGDGDDEMTDFYAEADGGPVLGIPHTNGLSCRGLSQDEAAWACRLNQGEINGNSYSYDQKLTSRRGFHARHNRLPGMAARSVRRGRRKAKLKKAKEKSLREQDLNSLSKLSLDTRSKRIRLEGFKDTVNSRPEWPSPKVFSNSPEFTISKSSETNSKEDMDIPAEPAESGNTPQATNASFPS